MESNLSNILRERIHAEGFEIVYDPPGNEMCFYDAAGYLLRESGQNLKERIFQYLRENRCDGNGNDRRLFICDVDIGQEVPESWEETSNLLEHNWANNLVVTILPLVCKRRVQIITAYGDEPSNYVKDYLPNEASNDEPIHLGHTGNHYVALRRCTKDADGQPNSSMGFQEKRAPGFERTAAPLAAPVHKVTLTKRGLTKQEFKKSLEAKLRQLSSKDLGTRNTVKEVSKIVCLRENETEPRNLDQRFSSPKKYEAEGIIPNVITSPMQHFKSQKDQERKQGAEKLPNKKQRKQYHAKQHQLFVDKWSKDQSFQDIFCLSNGKISSLEVKGISSLYFIDNLGLSRRLNTAEFCDVIDKITLKYVEELNSIITTKGFNLTHDAIERRKQNIDDIIAYCKGIVMGRFSVDMMVDNDLLNPDSYKQWREHVWVLISFSATLVLLLNLSSQLISALQHSDEKKALYYFKQLPEL